MSVEKESLRIQGELREWAVVHFRKVRIFSSKLPKVGFCRVKIPIVCVCFYAGLEGSLWSLAVIELSGEYPVGIFWGW